MKIRRPKPEIRRKSEGRRPNQHTVRRPRVPVAAVGNHRVRQLARPFPPPQPIVPANRALEHRGKGRTTESGRKNTGCTAFGFRASDFLRISDFGFRILAGALSLLATYLSFGAATNSPAPDEIPPLRPPHGEIPPTFWEQYGSWVILGGVALLALASVGAWFLTRAKPPVVVAPEEQARRALETLRERREDGALLSRVSQILRHYVIAAFNLSPEELTTAEFCRTIAAQGQIGPELCAALGEFLRRCDQRKFSPPAPAPPLGVVAQAFKLIEQAQARRAALARPQTQVSGGPNSASPSPGVAE